ncbi:MAG: alcohol dehydrogenase catalytic domain-containing protein [Pseudomonadota bacterium]
MKAMVLRQFGQPFGEEDVPLPAIGDHDLLIKTEACGVCYTDVKIASGLFPEISLPKILGHEVAGEVVGKGKKVRNRTHRKSLELYRNVKF